MDFGAVIKAHVGWKMKLNNYLKSPDGSLNPAEVQSDRKCALGEWLYGEGRNFSHLPEYTTLLEHHSRFHLAAAQVIRRADSGQNTSTDTALGAKSEFGSASTAVVSAIMAMERKVLSAA